MLFVKITHKCNYNNGGVTHKVTVYKEYYAGAKECRKLTKDEYKTLLPYSRYNSKSESVSTYESVAEIMDQLTDNSNEAIYYHNER